MTPQMFELLTLKSRGLHGNMYVLPVAAWALQSGAAVLSAREAMVGLQGQADRLRILEALARLCEIGALRELPREGRRNAPRFFERVESPYWSLVETFVLDLDLPEAGREGLSDPVSSRMR